MALFWLRTSYHAQRFMFQSYMLRSLLTQSFNIVNTPIILLFSKKWVPGFAAEDLHGKEVMFSGKLVCLFFCLSVCLFAILLYSKI